MDIDWSKVRVEMINLTDRRDKLCKDANKVKLSCPECDTRQVQLYSYVGVVPAVWRCRHCKFVWKWEGLDDV